MSQHAERLKSLKVKRGNIKAQMTRFKTFLNVPDQLIHNIQVRYNQAEKLLDKFEEYQSEIEELDASEEQSNERIAFENVYFDTLALANQILNSNSGGQSQSSAASSSSRTSDINGSQTAKQVKLPSINLPTFSGLYDEWLNFSEMFKTLVDENESLSDIQRFNYLRTSLKGDASQVIASLQLSAANYKAAWDLLADRYNNTRAIINKHITALFELPAVTKESHTSIRQLIDEINKHLRALKTLEAPTDSWDLLINHLILTKLDYTTKKEWELSQTGNSSATLEEMKAFLLSRAQAYENIRQPQTIKQTNTYKTNSSNKQFNQTKTYLSFEQPKCQLCKEKHALYKCKKLLDLSVADRICQLKKLKVCYNCLKSNHVSQDCTAGKCRVCNKNHNTLIHSDEISPAKSSHADEEREGSVTTHAATDSQVLLATALVYVIDKQGKAHEFRAMLDSGSQSNFITKRLCTKLNLQCQSFNMPVIGISQVQTNIKQKTDVTIKSRVNGFKEELSCLVLPEITGILPNKQIIKEDLNIPDHITLADPNFHIPKTIDLLIGSSIFWKLICVGQFKLANGHSTLQKTQLGWIIAGPIAQNQAKGREHTICNLNLEHSVENFWKVEEYEEHTKILSEEEKGCEEHFTKTTTINENGKFVVSLPLRESVINLGESKTEALKRLHSIERKCQRNPQLRVEYSKFMREYLDLGHMVEVSSNNTPEKIYYLPHHAIQRKESETTKLRVVFDGSSKTTTGLSLNDTMMIGPTIQETLFSIVTRFRSYEHAITADIAKMYRQIYIIEEEQDLQRILWRFNDEDEVKEYKLTTVTYGTAAAPYLAVRCLQDVANQVQKTDSIAADAICKNFYVDDFIAGANSMDEAIKLAQTVSNILKSRGFPLRKWASNNKEILQALLQHSIPNSSDVFISDKAEQKILGLIWKTESDTLQYKVDMNAIPMKVTKRTLLGIIAQVFDPLGLVGPVTIKPKLILQQLWQAGISWDESLPMHLYTIWRNTHEKLHHLNELKIPKNVIIHKCVNLQLHGFADASERAYGASIYCRTYNTVGSVNVNLIAAKARIAPLKAITVPRLELSAAVLLAKLMNSVIKSIQIPIDDVSYWTDSIITLSWIVGQPNQWKTFVGNRVATIQRLTNSQQWYHVSSSENPADIISRGLDADQLIENNLWWHGPRWLQEINWQHSQPTIEDTNLERRQEISLHTQFDDFEILTKYSSFNKLQRVIAYCMRFIHNTTRGLNKYLGILTAQELENARKTIISITQRREFQSEFNDLKTKGEIDKSSNLLNLSPYLDEDGLIRVGGRLQSSNLVNDHKHPYILLNNHHITNIIIADEHVRLKHCGHEQLLASIRLKYWPVAGRQAVKRITRKCLICFKFRPQKLTHKMGNLPSERINAVSRPFTVTGVDYAGPINLKQARGRGRPIITKGYISVFVCFNTKAIHLELISDLTSEGFLAALRRFTSRRGLCKTLYSDGMNGTNFTGANAKLQEIYNYLKNDQENITQTLAKQNIEWKFIPPRAPHFGGLWEAAVKSMKSHFFKVTKDLVMTYEECYTVLVEIEAILNSRPLTPLSTSPDDLNPLTPSHFLIGDILTQPLEMSFTDTSSNLSTRWQHMQQVRQHFWARWHKEYLHQLQVRAKWHTSAPNVKVGTLVLLINDNTPSMQWKTGRIIATHPGTDGSVRVVTVQSASGCVKRPVKKLCALPIESATKE